MSGCSVSAPGGANINCISYLAKAKGVIIVDPTVTFATLAALDNIENMRVLLQETRTGYVMEFNGTEPTQAEAVDETTGFGQVITTEENAPSAVAYAKTNACDFREILDAYAGGTYRILPYGSDGTLMVTESGDEYAGFIAQVFAQAIGIQGQDNQSQSYRVKFNFQSSAEFRKYKVVSVNYSFDDLKLLLPVGLSQEISTAFTGTNVVVAVQTRCVEDSPHSGVMTGEVTKSTKGLTVTAVPTDNVDGTYTVVVQKTGAVDLAAGEYAEYILVTKTGNVYDEVSNSIKVTGS